MSSTDTMDIQPRPSIEYSWRRQYSVPSVRYISPVNCACDAAYAVDPQSTPIDKGRRLYYHYNVDESVCSMLTDTHRPQRPPPQLSAYRGQLCDCTVKLTRILLQIPSLLLRCSVKSATCYCYILHAQTIPDGSPQFDVSFPGKLPKIVATRGEIFSLKFTKYRLAGARTP